MPEQHAKLSPSGSATWMGCPASVTLVRRHGLQELDTSTPASDFGTECHRISEEALINDTSVPKDVPELMYLYATRYVAYIKDRAMFRKAYYEARVELDGECWGTSDTILPDTRIPAVIDLKTGQMIVYAKDSKQLRIYALAMLKTFNIAFEDIDGVELTIFQPSCESISTYTVTVEELREFNNQYLNARQNLVLRPEDYNPSSSSCQWCRAKSHCKAYEKVIEEEARLAFADFEAVSNERLATMLTWLPSLKRMIDEVQDQARARMQDVEGSVPGYRLSDPYQRRVWNEQKLRQVANEFDLVNLLFEEKPVKFGGLDTLLLNLEDDVRDSVHDCVDVKVGAPRILTEKSD